LLKSEGGGLPGDVDADLIAAYDISLRLHIAINDSATVGLDG
jgi:hypothetical protein